MHIPVLVTFLISLAAFVTPFQVMPQSVPGYLQVISPRAGEALLGNIEISGVTEIPDFARTEVEFRYTNDPKDTWFLISETDKTVNPGKIADWDTTTTTDGNYDLRVTVVLKSGESKSVIIHGVRIRNYSPVETPTPVKSGATAKLEVTEVTPLPTRTLRPTPVVLSANPAVLTSVDLNSSLIRGAAAGIGFFLAFAIYWIVKKSLS